MATYGKRPGAPNVKIWVSSLANSGACAVGAIRLLISVSRASAFRLEKIPSLRFGFGAGTGGAGGGLGLAAFGAGGGVGLDFGGSGFFCVNCSYSSYNVNAQ